MADDDLAETLNLENLDEFVNDEKRIVTCKWLSNSLRVSGNKSKEILKHFIKEELKRKQELTVTYLVGGFVSLKDEKLAYKYVIVKEKDVEETKKQFKKITCCHVYSVQRSSLKNSEMLCSVDVDMVKNSLHELISWSNIYCPEAKRDEKSLITRRVPTSETGLLNGIPNTKAPAKGDSIHKESKKTVSIAKESSKLSTEQPSASTSTSKKPTTTTSFFGSSNAKTKEKKSAPAEKPQETQKASKEQNNPTKPSKKQKNELSFFGKPMQEKSKSKPKTEESNSTSEKTETKKIETKKTESDKDEMEVDVETTAAKADISQKERAKKKTKRDENVAVEDDRKDAKRRKTVIQESDSEEDGFESFIKSSKSKEESKRVEKKIVQASSEEEEKMVVDEPKIKEKIKKKKKEVVDKAESESKKLQNPVKKKKEKVPTEQYTEPLTPINDDDDDVKSESKPKEKRRVRRKVLRSKTFMNDEGYMVTEKVYESESATDESEPESAKPKKPDLAHRKPKDIAAENKKLRQEAAKHKGQASLMSFFKKK